MSIAAALVVLAIFVVIAAQVDDWRRDLTTNRATTSAEASDFLMRSLELPVTANAVRTAIDRCVEREVAWNHGEMTSDSDTETSLRLTRTSRLFRFVDDVRVFLQPTERGTLVDVASQSRVGKGDLGQNPRNIRELMQALRNEFNVPI